MRFGSAYGPTPNTPDQPAVLNFTVVPTDHDATPQLAAYEGGRKRLLQMSFRDLERALIDVLDRSVNKSGGDFEPQRDMHSIMINRWNYGYAHELTSVWDPSLYGPWANQPQVRGPQAGQERVDRQQRLGRVRLHPPRDQRGLPGGAGPARVAAAAVAAVAEPRQEQFGLVASYIAAHADRPHRSGEHGGGARPRLG